MERDRKLRVSRVLGLAFGALLLHGCTDETLAPDGTAGPPLFETVPGVSVTKNQMATQLDRQTRALAMALGNNPALQRDVERMISESPFEESKLEFRSLIGDETLGLTEAMAAATRSEARDIREAVDSLMPLELYFPVKEHRATWRAGSPLLVVSLLDDHDASTLSGYNLDGEAVQLSLDAPPDQPALSLVPAETNFAAGPRSEGPPEAGPDQSMMMSGGNIYLDATYLTDTHEPWPQGDPEIAVHIAIRGSTSTVTWTSCAGDDVPAPYYFDQNTNSWTSGPVNLITQAGVEDKEFEVYVWEDDYERCDGTNHLIPHEGDPILDNINAVSQAIIEIENDDGDLWERLVNGWQKVYGLVPGLAEDDFVGVAKDLLGSCYPPGGGGIKHNLTDDSGNYKGWVILNQDFAEREICPMRASIEGPSSVQSTWPCTWEAGAVQNGVPPYSYEWSGFLSGTGSSAFGGTSYSDWIYLEVTDDRDVTAYTSLYVTVDPNAPSCPL